MKNKYVVMFLLFPLIVGLGLFAFQDRQYTLISWLLIFLTCFIFYYKYEKRQPQGREIIIMAVMITLIVLGRLLFILTPSFKPTIALIILFGMSFGEVSGFVCGSMSVFLSNFFFGQGPWTPFQMMACGWIGMLSGLLNRKGYLEKNLCFQVIYGILTGACYSLIMDLWTLLSLERTFVWQRYIAVILSSLPVTFAYMVSNVLFLVVLTPTMLKKLERIKLKYGLYERSIYEKNHS